MLLGPQTFVPIAWLCKKQGAISHSTTEAETISLDAGLRLEALPLLMLWDIVIDTFSTEAEKKILRAQNAGGVILGSGDLADECRKAISPSGQIVASSHAPAVAAAKFPNDLLIYIRWKILTGYLHQCLACLDSRDFLLVKITMRS